MERATVLIYEECRLLKKGIIDSVFEPMAHPRQAKFLLQPKYNGDKRWIEECISIYITSARFKSEWFWRTFKEVVQECYTNKQLSYSFFAGDIYLAIMHGLKTWGDLSKGKKTMNELDYRMEILNEMIGEAEDAFFTMELFRKNQVLTKPFIPLNFINQYGRKEWKFKEKQNNESRLLFVDYAFANTTGKTENDNSVIGGMSMFYRNGKLYRNIDFIMTHPASDSFGMERKIRELFWDYHADYIVPDLFVSSLL